MSSTVEEPETVVVHAVAFENQSEVDVSFNEDDNPVVENFDEVAKKDVARCIEREAVEDIGWEHDVIHPEDSLWRDEFADMDVGDEIEL